METNKTIKTFQGKEIFKKNGYKLRMVLKHDTSSMRMSVGFFLVAPNGSVSKMTTIKRHNIKFGNSAFDFMLDYVAGFEKKEIVEIIKKVKDEVDIMESEMYSTVATVDEVYQTLCDYIISKATDKKEKDIYIENGLGHIKTTCLKKFVNEYSDLGYSRKEILENLKMCGLLSYDLDRSYDKQISIDGKKVRFYVIVLPVDEESGVKSCLQ